MNNSTTPALLIINLGSPKSPAVCDVRSYLREFLMDRYVIDLPWPLRWFLVYVAITPFRAPQSAEKYAMIWSPQTESPLLHNSKQFTEKLQRQLNQSGDGLRVQLAMRYGEPDLRATLHELLNHKQLYVMPVYPQYAESSTKSALVEVRRILRKFKFKGEIFECRGFSQHPGFISAVSENIALEIERFQPDYLLLSYHGLPIRQAGTYRDQCFATSEAITDNLVARGAWPKEKITVGFQSRLNNRWIQPYSDYFYRTLPARGVRRLLVACPSFVADCLETLEEVAIRGRDEFRAHGGEELRLAPCLNDSPGWVKAAADIFCDSNYWTAHKL